MRVADPELDRLHGIVGGLGYAVLMTDREGITLARRVREADECGCRYWSLWTGSVWSEAVEGTNGVGTCLVEQRAVTVHREQHFRARHTRLSCTVAPVFDACGRLAGALDISSFQPPEGDGILPLAMAAVQETARRIEAALFHEVFARCLVLALPAPAGDPQAVPLLALDADRRILGATRAARALLGLDDRMLEAGTGLGGVLTGPESASLRAAERMAIRGALSQTQGNVARAAQLLGLSRATLHRKIRALGLRREEAFR